MAPHAMPPVAPFPEGIPVFLGRSYVWRLPPEILPSLLLYDDWDILWVRKGRCAWAFADGRSITAQQDEFAVIPPFTPAYPRLSRTPLEYWYCHFDFRPVPKKVLERFQGDAKGPGPGAMLPLQFRRRDAPGVWAAYKALIEVPFQTPGGYWRMERATLRLVEELALFAGRWTAAGNTGQPFSPVDVTDKRIVRIREKIGLDPAHQWKVEDLAAGEGISVSHLYNLSTAMLGMSLKEFIIHSRLQFAVGLLQHRPGEPPLSLKEVSVRSGFDSQHYFSRLFKQRYGISPSRYRQQAADF